MSISPTIPQSPDTLVTGSSGHLGAALMLTLHTQNLTPLGIDILSSEYTHLTGSITDADFIAQVLTNYPTITSIIHTATLHKPHISTHPAQAFIDTNISGTQKLLEAAVATKGRILSFVFVSTTSAFGDALAAPAASPANWIDETVREMPKNIYGVTKVAAENLCLLKHRQDGLPIVVLRTSRFFPEEDDAPERRMSVQDEALKVQELLYRRVELADVVLACVCAVRKAGELKWGMYVISAPSPFKRRPHVLQRLGEGNIRGAVDEVVPMAVQVFEAKGWPWLDRIDRIYDSRRAVEELGWRPQFTFEATLEKIREEKAWQSEVMLKVGKRGYHEKSIGVYTIR